MMPHQLHNFEAWLENASQDRIEERVDRLERQKAEGGRGHSVEEIDALIAMCEEALGLDDFDEDDLEEVERVLEVEEALEDAPQPIEVEEAFDGLSDLVDEVMSLGPIEE